MTRVDITSRLQANEDPVMVIGDVELTVRSDANIVLQIMDLITEGLTVANLLKAKSLLFSDEDEAKFNELGLKMVNWKDAIGYAAQLAVSGELKEDDEAAGE